MPKKKANPLAKVPMIATSTSQRGVKKTANIPGGSMGASPSGASFGAHGGNAFPTSQTSSFFYSPELTPDSWLLPKSRQEITKWCRIFYNLDAYIRSILDMHAQYPFSKFDIITSDPSVTEFYKENASNANFDLAEFILRASLRYWKFGEAIMFGNMALDQEDGKYKWENFILLEPELVEIRQELFEDKPRFELVPTEELKRLARSVDPVAQQRQKDIPAVVLESVKNNRLIPLDGDQVSMVANITDPSATRGTPIIQCLAGDTKIALLDGTTPTLEQMYKENRKDIWTYSCDSGGNISPAKGEGVVLTKYAEVIKVTIDNGESFKCTLDHKIMLRDGTYKEAGQLLPGDSLMPLYRKESKLHELGKTLTGYELLYKNDLNL